MEEQFNSTFGKAGCHIENIGELLQEFDQTFVTEDGKVSLTGEEFLRLISSLFEKFQETMLECEGKEFVIEFGDSSTANLLETIVKFVLSFSPSANAEPDAKA